MPNHSQSVLLWIHEECLNLFSPALQAYPAAPRVFVFDEDAIQPASLKRIVFQYECLLEIPALEIRKGPSTDELITAAEEHGCTQIVTVTGISPDFQRICAALRREPRLTLTLLAPEPFLELSAGETKRLDLKRFSRYWQAIKRQALTLNQHFDW